jgi:hypothetical protein
VIDALLLDFYGTVVHEDDVVINQICETTSRAAPTQATPKEIGRYWWTAFSDAFKHSHGTHFETDFGTNSKEPVDYPNAKGVYELRSPN